MAVLASRRRPATLLRQAGAAVFMFLFAAQALAQGDIAALQIKAAFLHKFATYVQGEGTAFERNDTPLVFGIAGSEPMYEFLVQLVEAQSPDMRSAQVRLVNGLGDLAGVHVLYVGQAALNAAELLSAAVPASILTVCDVDGPRPPGAMIHFFVADDRVRFDIDLAPADAAGLRLSSRLLQVARQVESQAETNGTAGD